MEQKEGNMVHIKDDQRSRKSAELIREGLERCLQRNSFTEITVTEIIKESGVGRATFYRLFDNSCDVLAYQCDLLAGQLVEQFQNIPARKQDFLRFSLDFWLSHHASLEAVFASNRTDILQEAMLNHGEYLIRYFGWQEISQKEMDYFLATASSVLSSMLMVWIKHGKTETAESVYRMYVKAMVLTAKMNTDTR